MDAYTLHAARTIGMAAKQDEYDTQIIKKVWSRDMSNLSDEQSSNACEFVYEKQGSEAYNKCYQAYKSCGSNANCAILAKKFSEALAEGYSKDFEQFKKKTNFMSQAGEIAGGLISGLFGNSNANRNNQLGISSGGYYAPPTQRRTGLYIGIGVLAVAGIATAATAVYFARKNR